LVAQGLYIGPKTYINACLHDATSFMNLVACNFCSILLTYLPVMKNHMRLRLHGTIACDYGWPSYLQLIIFTGSIINYTTCKIIFTACINKNTGQSYPQLKIFTGSIINYTGLVV
jgi:hypothetical protein